jgi:hypothetical protein
MSECGDAFSEPGHSESGRAHIHTAPSATQIERHAYQMDGHVAPVGATKDWIGTHV